MANDLPVSSDPALEWIVGSYIVEEGEQPEGPRDVRDIVETILWMTADGLPLSIDKQRGGLDAERVRRTYEAAVASPPPTGLAHTLPGRIRTASAEIIVALEGYLPSDVTLILGETPEIETLSAQLETHFTRAEQPRRRVPLDETPALPGPGLFRAAAAYHRKAPWRLFPSDQDIVLFSVPSLGIHEAVLSVMGQDGDNHGLLFFYSVRDFEAYVAAAVNDAGVFSSTGNDIDKDKLPAHLALTFDAAKHIPREMQKLVKARHWELAEGDAYPAVMAVDAGMRARAPKAWEQLLLEIAALGFAKLLDDESAVRRAYRTDTFYDDEFELETSMGPIAAILGGPVGADDEDDEDDEDAPAAAIEVAPVDGSPEALFARCEELIGAFADADEAEPFFDVSAVAAFLMHAAQAHTRLAEAIDPGLVREILLEEYPRDVIVPPQIAAEIVRGLQAFFAWLARTMSDRAPHAAACAVLLDESFMRTLWAELCTPARWSAEKRPHMDGMRLPPVPPKTKPVGPLSQAEKNKQKAARRKR